MVVAEQNDILNLFLIIFSLAYQGCNKDLFRLSPTAGFLSFSLKIIFFQLFNFFISLLSDRKRLANNKIFSL